MPSENQSAWIWITSDLDHVRHYLRFHPSRKKRSHVYQISMQLNESTRIVNEYDQKIPQSQTADNPVACFDFP